MQMMVKISNSGSIIKAYHGSFSKITKFKARKEYSEVEVRFDRYIGPHFAADWKLAENVVKVHAIGLGIFYGSENKKAYIHEVALECSKIYDLPDHSNSWIINDEGNFEIDIAEKVFPKRKDLFVMYYSKTRLIPKEELEKVYGILADNIPVSIEGLRLTEKLMNELKTTTFGAIGFNHSFLVNSQEDLQIVDEYRNILLSQGYTCIRYKNTAPMEIKGVSDKTCYVVIDPSIIKITGVREIEIH